jgi:hypothetical protein
LGQYEAFGEIIDGRFEVKSECSDRRRLGPLVVSTICLNIAGMDIEFRSIPKINSSIVSGRVMVVKDSDLCEYEGVASIAGLRSDGDEGRHRGRLGTWIGVSRRRGAVAGNWNEPRKEQLRRDCQVASSWVTQQAI